MASSRLEKIGTIYSRITGLLRSGAMKMEDRPLWYDVYTAYPPFIEPKFDRPAPVCTLTPIFYEEDKIRAKFHKTSNAAYNLTEDGNKTVSQQFIEIHRHLNSQGALSEEQIFGTARVMLEDKLQEMKASRESIQGTNQSLLSNFNEAKSTGPTINLKNIFEG